MRSADRILECLNSNRAILADFGVSSLYLFGSQARGDAAEQSDVDLLVEFSRPVGLFHFSRLKLRLEEILGARVDLVERAALRPGMRDAILAEAIRAA